MAPLLPTAVMKGLVFKVPLSESVKPQESGTEVNHYVKVMIKMEGLKESERKRERERERERERREV